MAFFLKTRPRAFFLAFTGFGLATVAPPGGKGFVPFLLSAPGLAIAGVALAMLGLSIEETGTILRIRIGVGTRLVAFGLAVFAGIWGFFLSQPLAPLMGFAVVLYGVGIAGAAIAFRHDFGVFEDVRYGQAIRLEKITPSAVSLLVSGVATTIPTGLVRSVALAKNMEGRAAFVHVVGRDKIVGAVNQLPWVSAAREGDTFVLTEHQAGFDVEVFASQLLEAAEAARESGYR